MSIDFRELEQFRDKMQDLGEHGASQLCDKCAKELTGRLLAKVVKRTPTGLPPEGISEDTYDKYWQGYAGGTLKRGWTGDQKVSNLTQYANGLPVNVMSNNHRIEVINQVKYAPYVEYGHRQTPGRFIPALGKRAVSSWVPGQFMLTKSVAEIDSIAQPLVDKRTKEFIKGAFS